MSNSPASILHGASATLMSKRRRQRISASRNSSAARSAGSQPVSSSLACAHASWSGVDERVKIRNSDTGFAGEYIHNTATLTWSASESGFSFTSDPLDSDFAEIGHERNGVFFP